MPAKSKAVNFSDAVLRRAVAAKESGISNSDFISRFRVSWDAVKKEAFERGFPVECK